MQQCVMPVYILASTLHIEMPPAGTWHDAVGRCTYFYEANVHTADSNCCACGSLPDLHCLAICRHPNSAFPLAFQTHPLQYNCCWKPSCNLGICFV